MEIKKERIRGPEVIDAVINECVFSSSSYIYLIVLQVTTSFRNSGFCSADVSPLRTCFYILCVGCSVLPGIIFHLADSSLVLFSVRRC